MAVEAPSALIFGSDNFVAKKLAELLANRGIAVFWDDEIVNKPLYFFDFGGGGDRYVEMTQKHIKTCLVEMADPPTSVKTDFVEAKGDFRIVKLHGVYGVGMDMSSWYGKAVELCARNKNLVLPKYGEKFRLLAVDDAVEAIMRAVIISGTNGKTFEVAGEEIESKDVAHVLIDLAKMTKTEIKEQTLPLTPSLDRAGVEEDYIASAKALRWKPVVEFKDGVKELVAEMVARVDEEARNTKKLVTSNKKLEKEIIERPRFMVKAEVEEVEEGSNLKLVTSNKMEEEEEVVDDDEVVEVEEDEIVGKKMEGSIAEPDLFREKVIVKEYVQIPITKPVIVKEVVAEKPKVGYIFPWAKVGIVLGLIVLVMGVVFGVYLWNVVNIVKNLDKPIKLLEEKKIDEAKKSVQKYLVLSKKLEDFWGNTKVGEINKISREVLKIEEKACLLAESVDKINSVVFEEKIIDTKMELNNISKLLLEVETEVGVLQGRLVSVRKWIPGRWRPQIDEVSELILKNIEMLSKTKQMVSILPEFLGLDGKRRDYLVLLQNEMEIRATGGFIGSYGILSFGDGRLVSFDVKDVYEADGQLKGHVEPPEEIKRYLGEAGWFMRDSNWKASFPASSKDIQWFFEKETGRKVDGIIGVNLAVIKSMLNATGPIFVPDFKEKISKDNLYEQAEFYSESKFFPGSVQKASFLGGMGKQLFLEIANLKTSQRYDLVLGLMESMEKNDLQMSLNDPAVAGLVADLGWDGEVFGGSCGTVDCYGDYLFVVESNFGVNKANYFLYRSIEQKVDIKEAGVDRTLRINYENMAKSGNWPGGDYKNYMRIYLPIDIQVSEVSVTSGGQKQILPLNEVKMTNMYNKRELGFLVLVPISSKVVVEVKYSSDFAQMKDKFSYMLYVQRQSGYGDTGMVNLISIPGGYQPMQVTPLASVVSGKLLFNQKLDKDIKLGVEIAR